VTLSDTFDRRDIAPPSDTALDDGDPFEAIRVAIADALARREIPQDDKRAEPVLAIAPFFIEFDEPARLDPERAGLTWELTAQRQRWMPLRSPLVSLGFHLLPLVAIILLPLLFVEPPLPIPVQLVFEQPPPPPPSQPVQAEAQSQPVQPAPAEPPPPKPVPASAKPPPVPPRPVHDDAQSQPVQPAPSRLTSVAQPAKPPAVPAPTPPPPREAPTARYPGRAATPDEYLAYLVTLTEQHLDLLPTSLVGGRRGETVLNIALHRDGVIDRISLARSSGYPDIDGRVEQMVAAVGKFPPLPDAFEGTTVELEFNFLFPEALRAH
jgi:TonB family protein